MTIFYRETPYAHSEVSREAYKARLRTLNRRFEHTARPKWRIKTTYQGFIPIKTLIEVPTTPTGHIHMDSIRGQLFGGAA